MNKREIIFAFFIVFAATLNFGFATGDIDRPDHHNMSGLWAAIVVNLIATALKFGERTQLGAMHLATSLVADFQLIAAAVVWATAEAASGGGMTPATTVSVVSLAWGALLANLVSVIMLVVDTFRSQR